LLVKPIITEAEPLYSLLARVSIRAKNDEEWIYVRERVREATLLFEKVVLTARKSGLKIPENIKYKINRLSKLEGPEEIITGLSEIEEELKQLFLYYNGASTYTLKTRLISGIMVIIISLYLIYEAPNTLALTLATLGLGLGVAGVLTYFSSLSPIVSIIGTLVLIPLLPKDPYILLAWGLTFLSSITASIIPILLLENPQQVESSANTSRS